MANVGIARLMLTAQVLDTSNRRWWARNEAIGTDTTTATTVTMAHRTTVSPNDSRMPPGPVQVSASKNHSKNPMSRGTAVWPGAVRRTVAITNRPSIVGAPTGSTAGR